jgi:hypothetical protein
MATATQHDQPEAEAVEAFAGRALDDVAGTMATIFCIVGDRLGLFVALDEGPATAAELAARTTVDERYALEWLRGLTAAGYLEQEDDRYTLPATHAPVLAREGGAAFLGGGYHELGGMLPALERVVEAFRAGGGVPQAAIRTTRTTGWPASARPGSTMGCSRAGCLCSPACRIGSRTGSTGPTWAAARATP